MSNAQTQVLIKHYKMVVKYVFIEKVKDLHRWIFIQQDHKTASFDAWLWYLHTVNASINENTFSQLQVKVQFVSLYS